MAVAITLSNGRTWRMKAAALSHFKATLAHYADGNVAEDRNDHDDLVALLEPYDEAITDCIYHVDLRKENPYHQEIPYNPGIEPS
jgi:hypothetical protein